MSIRSNMISCRQNKWENKEGDWRNKAHPFCICSNWTNMFGWHWIFMDNKLSVHYICIWLISTCRKSTVDNEQSFIIKQSHCHISMRLSNDFSWNFLFSWIWLNLKNRRLIPNLKMRSIGRDHHQNSHVDFFLVSDLWLFRRSLGVDNCNHHSVQPTMGQGMSEVRYVCRPSDEYPWILH